jgi:putative component of membrane protein insertase Oxa1/YidC/SpoIIIJ protein YidD
LLILALSAAPREAGGPAGLLFAEYRAVAGGALGRQCVFRPSCSQYAREAFEDLGPLAGAALSLERWTRCHSFAWSETDYERTSGGALADPLHSPEEDLPSWGLPLLPF